MEVMKVTELMEVTIIDQLPFDCHSQYSVIRRNGALLSTVSNSIN